VTHLAGISRLRRAENNEAFDNSSSSALLQKRWFVNRMLSRDCVRIYEAR
jgi:hypothetical protein